MKGSIVQFFDNADCAAGVIMGAPIEPDFDEVPIETVLSIGASSPDLPALSSTLGTMTYGELCARIAGLASRLRDCGVLPGARVGVMMPNCEDAIVAILGIQASDAAYVSIDPSLDGAEVARLASSLGIDVCVVSETVPTHPAATSFQCIHTSGTGPASNSTPAAVTSLNIAPADEAYVIHTSGSGGSPKSVSVSHANLSAMNAARRMVYPGIDRFLLLSPHWFDSSVAGIFGTLSQGGTLFLADESAFADPEALRAMIVRERITHTLCVPSLYAAILSGADAVGPTGVGELACVTLAGEPVPPGLVGAHDSSAFASATLVNEYGPSEATVWCSYAELRPGEAVTIGGPVPGVGLAVLQADGTLGCDEGDEGELVVAGAGLSSGYVGDASATQRSRFITIAGRSFFRTGDRVRMRGREFVHLGRLDQRVKVRGQWVDLAAIERFVMTRPECREAAVVPSGDGELHLFLCASASFERQVGRHIRERFPAHCLPHRTLTLDSMPRTRTGKLDRAELRRRASMPNTGHAPMSGDGPRRSPSGPDSGLRHHVLEAWKTLLKTDKVHEEASFFEQGGHSLLIFRLRDVLKASTGIELPMIDLFDAVTVQQQVEALRARQEAGATDTTTSRATAAAAVRSSPTVSVPRPAMGAGS